MRNIYHIIFLLLLFNYSFAQQKYVISGYVYEKETSESLIGANVIINEVNKGISSNNYGFYSITLPEGEYTISTSFIGYKDFKEKITLTKNIKLDIYLQKSSIITQDVIITAEKADKNITQSQLSTVDLKVEQIKVMPSLMGEVDILKTIQLLPGVQAANEGSTSFYVRGGGPDQNLILLDEATVYNASHLLGFFSVFNADAIKNVKLIKGGMPARYGGRLSSVLDISMRDGNFNDYSTQGGIGLIASRLTAEGPLVKNKSSFLITARRTYADVLVAPFLKGTDYEGNKYYFYDVNAKINYRISDKDRIYLSSYFGRDVFTFKSPDAGIGFDVPWGNATASFRWNHLFSDKLFSNTSIVFSDYNFEFGAEQSDFEIVLFSGIRDWNLKLDFSYIPNIRHHIRFGFQGTNHIFTPSNISGRVGDTQFNSDGVIEQHALEGGLYLEDDFEVNEKLKINAGIRLSAFKQIGPFNRYIKNDLGLTTDTIIYGNGDSIATYSGFEPRLSARYKLSDNSSLKMSFSQNYQYVHLATLSTTALPTDTWIPSSDLVEPQFATQYATGYFHNFLDNGIETSVELYYKKMDNMIEYEEGYQPGTDIDDNTDNHLTFGEGESYGIELLAKKNKGQLTGWVGYTLSKTTREFDEINNGMSFLATYDRTHDISISATYPINEKWTVSGVFVFATGNAITLPESRYIINGEIRTEYGERNSYRIKPYHRADLSFTRVGKKRKDFESSWNFSIYNLYNRQNVYFIYFDEEGSYEDGTLKLTAKQVSIFPILPTITWNFKF